MKQKLAVANALLPRRRCWSSTSRRRASTSSRAAEIWTLLERARERRAGPHQHELPGRGRRLRSPGLPRRGPRRRDRHAGRAARRVPLELYRAWGDDARAIARRGARACRYVAGARATGRFARVEVPPRRSRRARRACCTTWRRCAGGRALRRARAGRHGVDAARARGQAAHERARSSGRAGSPSASATSPRSTTSRIARRAGHDLRLPRRQRLGQEHDDPHADRPARRRRPGTIEVDGIDVIRRPAPRARPHRLHGAEGEPLPGAVAARERRVLRRALRARRRGRWSERWGALRERFALGDAEHEQPEDLPAGIRQRAGLALSMLHRPARALPRRADGRRRRPQPRRCFWELIQDEAARGVTVFVTTHFLEEVDYCDWVCFIDAGRLIANATPRGAAPPLLRRLPDRRIAAPPARARSVLRARSASSRAGAHGRATASLARRRRRSTPAVLDALDRRSPRCAGARPSHIEQPPMTEVFRRVLAAAERTPA